MSYRSETKRTLAKIYVGGVVASTLYFTYKIFRRMYRHRDGSIANGAALGASTVGGALMGAVWPLTMPGAATWEIVEATRNPNNDWSGYMGNS